MSDGTTLKIVTDKFKSTEFKNKWYGFLHM
jgi:hypothetical protein